MPRTGILVCLVSLVSLASFAQDLIVDLPPGETALADIGVFWLTRQSPLPPS